MPFVAEPCLRLDAVDAAREVRHLSRAAIVHVDDEEVAGREEASRAVGQPAPVRGPCGAPQEHDREDVLDENTLVAAIVGAEHQRAREALPLRSKPCEATSIWRRGWNL